MSERVRELSRDEVEAALAELARFVATPSIERLAERVERQIAMEQPVSVRRPIRRRLPERTVAAVAAIAFAVVGLIAAATAFHRTAGHGVGSGGDWAGLWPQAIRQDAETAQARADHDDQGLTWQRDAALMLQAFARDGLFWEDVTIEGLSESAAAGSGPVTVTITGCPFADPANPGSFGPSASSTAAEAQPATSTDASPYWKQGCPHQAVVTIERLLRTDQTGLWFVTSATVDGGPASIPSSPLPPVETTSPEAALPAEVTQFLTDFMGARADGHGAEPDLSAAAADQYAAGAGGISLYGYATGVEAAWSVSGWRAVPDRDSFQVVIEIRRDGSDVVIHEVLQVDHRPASSEYVVGSAERTE